MNLAVIGEPCIDYIHRGTNSSKKQLGGIMYSVISLSVIAEKAMVYPIFNLGEDEYSYFTEFLSNFPNIRTDFVFRCKHKTRIVHLYYKEINPSAKDNFNTYDREEISTEAAPALEREIGEIDFNNFDGVLVNFVSGSDITLKAFKTLREKFRAYIHTDIHNLVMKTHKDGIRTRHALDNWEEWCNCSDSVQMNEAELSVITGSNSQEEEIVREIRNKSLCKTVVITKGKYGATIYTDEGKKDFSPLSPEKFTDSTGCGDVFASAFFYSNLKNGFNYHKSMEYAIKAAAMNVTLDGVEKLKYLNRVNE
ncbi:MAG: carbohydrate kinase family protein [Ignavibacteria bacterium]|nr:carbohydrate kinase family protein [Ignavibacteria bacterium]